MPKSNFETVHNEIESLHDYYDEVEDQTSNDESHYDRDEAITKSLKSHGWTESEYEEVLTTRKIQLV